MSKIVRRAVLALGVLLIVAAFVACFLAYFVLSRSADRTVWYDGLGRTLEPAPWLARFYLGTDGMWAGLGWHVTDIVVFFGGFGVGLALARWGAANPEPKPSN